MKEKYNKLGYLLILLIASVIMPSCDEETKDAPCQDPSEEAVLSISVKPVTRGDGDSDIEVINSLRLILLDEAGKVKGNILTSYNSSKSAENFVETYNFDLALGKYKVYAIVNEGSINSFVSENEDKRFQGLTLQESLDSFIQGNSGFEDFVNNICFTPDYTKAIPYTSCYPITVDKSEVAATVYLVPVATKFDIKFFNYRNESVILNKVSIEKVANQNYLMAKIPEEYQYKGDNYWIDWLQEVSEDTTNHPELGSGNDSNDLVNDKWGWLTHYELPATSEHNSTNLIEEGTTWEIPAEETQIGGIPKPGLFSKKNLYLPESKYIPEDSSSQFYTISFEIQKGIDEVLVLIGEIYNLKTLFRNSYLIVNVEMSSEVDDIYVEILRWTTRDPVYGTIVPE